MSSTLRSLGFALCLLSAGNASALLEVHEAARAGDLHRVHELLAADPSLATVADERDCRPIHFAADGGHLPVLELLAEAGADLEVLDVDGDTPLHWAAYARHAAAVRWLAARGVALDPLNLRHETPLHSAVRRPGNPAIAALVEAGADLEIADEYGRTPLIWVARETNDVATVRLLIAHGADVDAQDRFGDTALCLAAWRGFRVLVNVLMDAGADIHADDELGGQLMTYALNKGLDRPYLALKAAGRAPDVSGPDSRLMLHAAAVGGSRVIVADLIAAGLPVDTADDYGWTPLHHAADKGRGPVAAVLLDSGADADRRTHSGFSPLNLAERCGSAAVVEALDVVDADAGPRRFPDLDGPFLGQGPPPATAELFAPDIVSTPLGGHSSLSFSPDGREAYWSVHVDRPDSGYTHGTVHVSRLEDGRWTAPRRAGFATEIDDDVPCVSPDGDRLFFMSRRALEPGGPAGGAERIWVCKRVDDGWGEPRPLPPVVNSMRQHWQFSVDAAGDLYFASRRGGPETRGIYVARLVGGSYVEPEFLGFAGEAPCVAPDGSYLLTSEWGDHGPANYVRFRREDGSWSERMNMTEASGGEVQGMCARVSPDGAAIFFLTHHGDANVIKWMDAGFLADMRREAGAPR
jgi:ankyrin repeat protein